MEARNWDRIKYWLSFRAARSASFDVQMRIKARPSDALRCAIAHRGMTDRAVNNREKPNNLRILPAHPYIDDRLAIAPRLGKT